MRISSISILKDDRSDCFSVMTILTVGDYLTFIERPYQDKGGIDEQREPLKTSSAIRIRRRMVEDISKGAILPPIVLGAVVKKAEFEKINDSYTTDMLSSLLETTDPSSLLIIDGMQRTTALFESDRIQIKDRQLRVEVWLSTNTNNLVYRMLVLNAAQVPWNLRRQIEVVFRSMIKEIKDSVPGMTVFTVSDGNRRTQGGQYQANDIIELYLAFGARKEKVETKERLADEFTRLDFIEATEDKDFTKVFYECLDYMTSIDKQFSRFTGIADPSVRFADGKDIFSSQPLRVGFITAFAKRILGRPGVERTHGERQTQANAIKTEVADYVQGLTLMTPDQIGVFLALGVLNESMQKPSGKVGDFEREFFTKAFDSLVELKFDVGSMEVCWRAY
ncbi:MAG TPA: hypothetical protein VGM30_19770 [Puia sp.]|jgi:hypothetical protein